MYAFTLTRAFTPAFYPMYTPTPIPILTPTPAPTSALYNLPRAPGHSLLGQGDS